MVEAASTKPYGFMRFEPGPGMGGHCLPVDPFYLTWKAREYDLSTEFIELAGKVNQQMPYFCLEKAERALNDAGKAVRGARILVVGVSYKAGVGDMRESPALKIIRLLSERGADVSYHDPFIPSIRLGEDDHGAAPVDAPRLSSVPFDRLEAYDAVVLVTDHTSFDYARLAREAKLVVDTRNATRRVREGARARIVTI